MEFIITILKHKSAIVNIFIKINVNSWCFFIINGYGFDIKYNILIIRLVYFKLEIKYISIN